MWQSGCGAIHEVVRGETAISGDKRVFIMFMGEYSHTIDAKGRLIIPSKFREQLGEEFVLTKGLDGCLSIYPNDEWAAFEEKLRALPLTNKNARTFSRFFVAVLRHVNWTSRGGFSYRQRCGNLLVWKKM